MSPRQLTLFCVVLATLATRWLSAAEPLPPAAQWVPAETVAALEVAQPQAILDWLEPRLATAITSNALYQKGIAGNPGFQQFLNGVDYIAGRLGTDWQTAVRKLTGGGLLLAVGAKGETLLIVDAQDPAMLDKLHELILGFNQTTAEAAAKDYQGVKVFSLGHDEAHCIVDGRLLVANHGEVLRRALDPAPQIRRQQPGQHPLLHLRPQGSRPPRHAGRGQPGHGEEVAQVPAGPGGVPW